MSYFFNSLASLVSGGTQVYPQRGFDAEASLEAIEKERYKLYL